MKSAATFNVFQEIGTERRAWIVITLILCSKGFYVRTFCNIPSSDVVCFFLICIVGGGIKVHSTLRPLNGLLCQPRVIMIMEKWVQWLAGETEVLGENLSQCRFVHHKPHILPVRAHGPPRWEASV
jgi:hypothetical protein